eukprot:CCRYP_002581-RB/>CCRYP_002581-RB protein AED:0.02 eAED:0.02 QI:292/1/1/1/1/0.75/4/1197/795
MMAGVISESRLRVRPTSRNGKERTSSQQKRYQRDKKCRSTLLPMLVIAVVWSLGCWLVIWMRMYQSFTVLDFKNDALRGKFGKREHILAVKLKQVLDGSTSIGIINASYSSSDNMLKEPSPVLSQLFDPAISKQVQSMLLSDIKYPQLILGAYLEPPLPLDNNGRLQLRTHTPANLTYVSYPYPNKADDAGIIGACSQNGAQWILPTFHPASMDHYFEGNVFRKKPMFDKRWELASGIINGTGEQYFDSESPPRGYCPVDADPYLPWIHDVFPSRDGKYVEFIISNKRRCNTDPKVFQSDLINLEPQVALMQPVPVKRIDDRSSMLSTEDARRMWSPVSNNTIIRNMISVNPDGVFKSPRYALATSINDADDDGKLTRFICRFHTVAIDLREQEPELRQVILGETLSNYPYNPEHANYLKRGSKPMLTSLEQGHDEQIWNAVYSIRCPVPKSDKVKNLTAIVASGESVSQPNGVPSLYVDLVPIRTPVRRKKEGFGVPGVTHTSDESSLFDPKREWGDSHIIPHVDASGRWSNIPICRPPGGEEESAATVVADQSNEERSASSAQENLEPTTIVANKKHFLVACVWASRSFSTRGQASPTDSSTSDRLREFLVYHTMIAGFDHIYVYDNSDSMDNNINATLAPVTDLLPKFVTRIPWPHRVCNNNRPGHSNPGERSSQYAAEASCRARYGPQTEWIASMDVDEFLIPVNKEWENIRLWLKHVTATEKDTKILSFFQTRALPNIDLLLPYDGKATKSCTVDRTNEKVLQSDATLNATCVMKVRKRLLVHEHRSNDT